MVAYSFKARFVTPILTCQKCGTIRAEGRRRHAGAGDALQLYTAMRTKQCRLILQTTCADASHIVLRWKRRPEIIIRGEKLSEALFATFAREDGFADFDDMARFWRDVHPDIRLFRGWLIKWPKLIGPVKMGADVRPWERAA